MAKDTKATKPARGGEKAAKEKQPRFARLKQIVQVFKMGRQLDPRMPYWMAIAFLGAGAVLFLVFFLLLSGPLFLSIPVSVLGGLLALMIVFSRRIQKAQFTQIDGQPGAAGWVLDNMRGGWRVTQGVAVTGQLDVVHRVLGRPGVILIGEGVPGRVKGLLAQEKKRVARVAGETPIYDIVIGEEEGQVGLRKLNRHLMGLPRNLTQPQVTALEKRLAALGGPKAPPVPKGPLPRNARMSGLERTMRRR
jgi:Domain of unknown function (DUF4191)